MAAVVWQALTFVEQAWLGLRLFGGVEVLGVFDVLTGDVRANGRFSRDKKFHLHFEKCDGFVILTEAIWIKIKSAANGVGTCALFCYCSSKPQTYAHYIPETFANVRKA